MATQMEDIISFLSEIVVPRSIYNYGRHPFWKESSGSILQLSCAGVTRQALPGW